MPDEPKKGMDRLTSQLYYIPAIIGRMGISIAEAQKALNADYVHSLGQLMAMLNYAAKDMPATNDTEGMKKWEALITVLRQMAPSRYQFTESTLEFNADLSESLSAAGGLGVGFGMAGVTVNASFSMGYARNYRAAAKITSVLHAIPADPTFGNTLLERAKTITDSDLPLPTNAVVDKALWDEVAAYRKAVTGNDMKKPLAISLPDTATTIAGANGAADVKISVARGNDFKQKITITVTDLPSKVTAAALEIPANATEGTLKLTATAASQGTFSVKVKAESTDALPCEGKFELRVT